MINKTEISAFQLVFILIHVQIGVGLINLPYDIFLKARSDAWISILLAGMIIQIIILLYGLLIRRFPHHHIYEIHFILFGKWIGRLMIVFYIAFYILAGSITLMNFVHYIKTWMMPQTPKWIFVALMCVIAVVIVKKNIQIIARFMVLSAVFFLGFIVAAIYSFKFGNLTFILPVGSSGLTTIAKGIGPSFLSFQGFEMLLIFFPFVKATNRTKIRAASIANLFVTFLYTLLMLASLLFFSPAELEIVPEPVLYLIKGFSFRIIERPDLIFTSMWIVLVATTFMGNIYVASVGVTTFVKTTNLKYVAIVLASICFFLTLSIKGVYQITTVTTLFHTYVIPIFILIPILLLLLSYIRRKKGVENE